MKEIQGRTDAQGRVLADWPKVYAECAKYPKFVIKIFNEDDYLTDRQIAWWKGILLPALSKDSGDSIPTWETRLKLAVLPDEFEPDYVTLKDETYPVIPSITKLSKHKMNVLIEGAVDKCHEWGFMWVTLPDTLLRKKNSEF